ncbi:MarR family winged helix-turn-helix transcriptional regulator [Fodinicola feengrottensis]|uniref:MarR family transcriptional regulator n=1 Tax=Fodinicola feengrottensis TaxID=435914 RepID=A0ABN2GS96_9ACTN|nr:MarR family transcriptional regulator [Fodinicola feengrottensis]
MKDSVDRHIEYWRHELAGYDALAEAIAGRIQLLARHMEKPKKDSLAEHGVQLWEFQTLKNLRRRGQPYEATPGELATALGMSPAAMTKRLDALERSGYVVREHDTQDRRKVTVRLTVAGMRTWARTVDDQGLVERRLVGALTLTEQDQLADLLRKMMLVAEQNDRT